MPDGGWVAIHQDITERKRAEECQRLRLYDNNKHGDLAARQHALCCGDTGGGNGVAGACLKPRLRRGLASQTLDFDGQLPPLSGQVFILGRMQLRDHIVHD
jgi:hypothetical protein